MLCEHDRDDLVRVIFFTALPKHDADKLGRHRLFNDVQAAHGVEIVLGHYVPEGASFSEKQTDINLALRLILDGLDDVYDKAFLLSADTDQVATARTFSKRLAPLGKSLVGVAPLNRKIPQGYSQFGVKGFTLSLDQHEQCVMPEIIVHEGRSLQRPPAYAPIVGWVHPDARPKGKPPKPPKKWTKGVRSGG